MSITDPTPPPTPSKPPQGTTLSLRLLLGSSLQLLGDGDGVWQKDRESKSEERDAGESQRFDRGEAAGVKVVQKVALEERLWSFINRERQSFLKQES